MYLRSFRARLATEVMTPQLITSRAPWILISSTMILVNVILRTVQPRSVRLLLFRYSSWKLASDGEVFYTTAEDHLNCTVGAHTHGVSLSPEKAPELRSTLSQMISLNCLREKEVPQVSYRTEPFQVADYSPLVHCPYEPQLVVLRGSAGHFMLLTEATMAARIGADGIMSRTTCAFLSDTLQTGHALRVSLALGTVSIRTSRTTNSIFPFQVRNSPKWWPIWKQLLLQTKRWRAFIGSVVERRYCSMKPFQF
jgi:hypothetical protein